MGIIDISTAQEAKASNYTKQCKVANNWNNFAISSGGTAHGGFNIFFIDGNIAFKLAANKIKIKGYKQITNY